MPLPLSIEDNIRAIVEDGLALADLAEEAALCRVVDHNPSVRDPLGAAPSLALTQEAFLPPPAACQVEVDQYAAELPARSLDNLHLFPHPPQVLVGHLLELYSTL